MSTLEQLNPRLDWLRSDDVHPFILCRKESRLSNPGSNFSLNWFPKKPIFMNPLRVEDLYFSNALLNMEARAFSKSGMGMDRWVFYDCSVIPGLVTGFAIKTEKLPDTIKDILGHENLVGEWTPVSMFIVIPTMVKGEWVAHNLSSMNSMIPKHDRLYGLGFLSKAFGLAYANIEVCCGMTQWGSPALRLHSHYGFIEVLTAHTPVHTYANTLTYRLKVDPPEWIRFFTGEESDEFNNRFEPAGFEVDPKSASSQLDFQMKIEQNQGPYYLSASEIRRKPLDEPLTVFRPKR